MVVTEHEKSSLVVDLVLKTAGSDGSVSNPSANKQRQVSHPSLSGERARMRENKTLCSSKRAFLISTGLKIGNQI